MNSIAAREDFKNAVMIFEEAFPGTNVIKEFKLTQSALRLEQPLVANQNTYEFPVMNNILSQNGTIFNTEIRLNMQDTFVPTHVGVFVGLPTSSVDTAWRLFSWPNPAVFANATQLQALYNGQLKIMVNNYQYTYGWDLQRHYNSPQTQQTAPLGAGSPADENNFADDGMYPMQPYVLFGGAQNVQISIKLPIAPSAVDANSRIVMMFRGVLAQQSTPVS